LISRSAKSFSVRKNKKWHPDSKKKVSKKKKAKKNGEEVEASAAKVTKEPPEKVHNAKQKSLQEPQATPN